ncbi:hypothetical protein AZE42_09107 [Rhizopogon vesiculosus]|uniref:Uncharacterized protein n=1 Tax=Rhizopogon vesiculosus TaxID=180088 RepID=A0A1J8QSK7_9AGAM|nr:hypothetical protein AZE42_09107 [Rhizopogon vesiculosus]
MQGDNPNLAVRPDFMSDKHQEAHQQLINEGLTEEQAARTLASLWTISNNTAKVEWADRLEHATAERLRAEEADEQRRQTLKDEEDAARIEERKKNKNHHTSRCPHHDACC